MIQEGLNDSTLSENGPPRNKKDNELETDIDNRYKYKVFFGRFLAQRME
jgi:hypothetical protein